MILRNECTAYTFNSTTRCGSVQDNTFGGVSSV